jgi:hypothetical protein
MHVVYQTAHEPRFEDDELPFWSGFTLLEWDEKEILSPEHLGRERVWKEPVNGVPTPHHDDGFLGDSLEGLAITNGSISVRELININLGTESLQDTYGKVASSRDWEHSPSVLKSFYDLEDARLKCVCAQCFCNFHPESDSLSIIQNPPICSCTLKKRLIDRWLCVRCYVREEKWARECKIGAVAGGEGDTPACLCNKRVDWLNFHTMCLWCKGAVF